MALAVAARASTQAHKSCQSRPKRAVAARYPPSSLRNVEADGLAAGVVVVDL